MPCQTMTSAASGLVIGLALLGAGSPAPPSPADGHGPGLRLKRIDERRRADLVEADDHTITFDQPGLVLTFGIELPPGRQVVEMREPGSITATDSTGRDLTAIEENPLGRRQHLELLPAWGEAPTAFQLVLALPSREATSFDLATTVDAVTATGTRNAVLEVGRQWTPLDPRLFPGKNVSARLRAGSGNVELQMRPGTVRAAIESVQLTGAGEPLVSNSSMWNDLMITYFFDGPYAAGLKARLTVRTGLKTIPLEISLAGQALP